MNSSAIVVPLLIKREIANDWEWTRVTSATMTQVSN
jgi:hypothetical protein